MAKAPPYQWNLPTRANEMRTRAKMIPLSEFFNGKLVCASCGKEKEPKDLGLSPNLDFLCLSGHERPSVRKSRKVKEEIAPPSVTNGNGRVKIRVKANG